MTALFRVCQEALTNVARHAQARRIWFDLHLLGVQDDNEQVRDRFLMGSHRLLAAQPAAAVEFLLRSRISPFAATRAFEMACGYDGMKWGRSLQEPAAKPHERGRKQPTASCDRRSLPLAIPGDCALRDEWDRRRRLSKVHVSTTTVYVATDICGILTEPSDLRFVEFGLS